MHYHLTYQLRLLSLLLLYALAVQASSPRSRILPRWGSLATYSLASSTSQLWIVIAHIHWSSLDPSSSSAQMKVHPHWSSHTRTEGSRRMRCPPTPIRRLVSQTVNRLLVSFLLLTWRSPWQIAMIFSAMLRRNTLESVGSVVSYINGTTVSAKIDRRICDAVEASTVHSVSCNPKYSRMSTLSNVLTIMTAAVVFFLLISDSSSPPPLVR